MRVAMLAVLALAAGPAMAEPALGVWKTEPDRKDLVSHIEISRCGQKLCGTILEAFNPAGQKVTTPNIGKRLFWGIEPKGNGAYGNGTVWVPLMDVTARADMKLEGNRLRVRGCKAMLCDGQTWTRLN